ncbi:hypothetical protein ACIQTZ_18865 [Paenarthrobacter sp. NPDC090520]|uniref:hypothetical protein n=1 Tax=unclassified Paenarthrobacter TaxID=2634190 RepID=UPI00381051BB
MTVQTWTLIDNDRTYPVPSYEVPYIQKRIDAAASGESNQFVEFVPHGESEKVRLAVNASTRLKSPSGEIV